MAKNSLSAKNYNGVMVNEYNLPIREYNGQRVITFKDVDSTHNRPAGTAARNFNTNKVHFIEDTDYFRVCADEIRAHKIMDISSKAREDIVFLTESGYLLLVKSFKDDLAWDVQRTLVNSYFRGSNSIEGIWDQASPDLKMAYELLKIQLNLQLKTQEIARNLDITNRKLDKISDIIRIDPVGWRYDCRKILYSIANKRGGFQNVADVYSEAYDLLERRAGVNLTTRLKHRLARIGATQAERKNLSRQDVIAADKKLTQIYIAIVKEMAIKEGINFDYSEDI